VIHEFAFSTTVEVPYLLTLEVFQVKSPLPNTFGQKTKDNKLLVQMPTSKKKIGKRP